MDDVRTSDERDAAKASVLPSLGSIYRDELHFVWRVVRRAGVPERHAEDVCHDVFVVVHRKLETFDPKRPLRPWLFVIAWQTASDFLRRASQKRELLHDGDHNVASNTRFDDRVEASNLVEKALSEVPADRRAVVLLHDLEGSSITEIATALDLNLNTVYSRLRVGRAEMVDAIRRFAEAEG